MRKSLQALIGFWLRHIHTRVTTLIGTMGIAGLAACIIILFSVADLAEEVWEKESFSFDRAVLLWIHSHANSTFDRLALAITELGNPNTAVTIAAVTFGILLLKRYREEALFFAVACAGAVILNTELKLVFERVRPRLWSSMIREVSYSFPSGHALGSMVMYGFIAYLLAYFFPRLSSLIYTLAVVLIGSIGVSRLYLGVHWPTDILAGYGVGFLWLTICITMLKLQKIRQQNRKYNG